MGQAIARPRLLQSRRRRALYVAVELGHQVASDAADPERAAASTRRRTEAASRLRDAGRNPLPFFFCFFCFFLPEHRRARGEWRRRVAGSTPLDGRLERAALLHGGAPSAGVVVHDDADDARLRCGPCRPEAREKSRRPRSPRVPCARGGGGVSGGAATAAAEERLHSTRRGGAAAPQARLRQAGARALGAAAAFAEPASSVRRVHLHAQPRLPRPARRSPP